MISLSSILSSLFLILGSILFGYGIFTNGDPMYLRSLGWNLNLIWGLIVIAVGLLFGLGHMLSKKYAPKSLD